MDAEQTSLPKASPALSLRDPSIKSQNILQLSSSSPTSLKVELASPQPSKVPSPVASPVHKLLVNTTLSSPTKASNNISLRSQNSIKISENTTFKNPSLSDTEKTEKDNQESIFKFGSKEYPNDLATDIVEERKAANIVEVPVLQNNINKIANMSKVLTNEANSLRESIKTLSEDIVRTKQELSIVKEENVNFPYHLFLIEIIINKIYMKCDCFELDSNNLIISAIFLGKPPVTLYDNSYGKIEDFNNINLGKSALFAMTYDKICSIKEFVINLQINKQPPCSNCVTKIAESKIDYTQDFLDLREELCKKWAKEQPNNDIMCTTSTPLAKNMFYLSCGDAHHSDSIGIIELTTRMSFLGKEITTSFSMRSKPKCTSVLMKDDNGMKMYSCQNVEMDRDGKILFDERSLNKKEIPRGANTMSVRSVSPVSQYSSGQGSMRNYTDYRSPYTNISNPGTIISDIKNFEKIKTYFM